MTIARPDVVLQCAANEKRSHRRGTDAVSFLPFRTVAGVRSEPAASPRKRASRDVAGARERGRAAGKAMTRTGTCPPACRRERQDLDDAATVTIGGQTINYTARAGTMIMKDEEGKPRASFFFISYTKDGADPAQRPVTFTFNGGPGSSSVWLHMGAFGPKRVVYARRRRPRRAPPYRTRRQRGHAARRDRPRLHRSGHDRLQPRHAVRATRTSSTASTPTSSRSASSSASGRRATAAGPRRSSWPARATAPRAPPASRAGCRQQGIYLNGIVLISSILNFQTASLRQRQRPAYGSSCRPTPRPPGITSGCRPICRPARSSTPSPRRSSSRSASTRTR